MHLDGLPLAIELAAARTTLLSPRMILERLDRRLSLLRWPAQDLPWRQQTLRSAIAWSYDLLSPEEYRLLQLALVARPDAGKIIRGTGGLRKFRWALSGRGKRGGARVIYFWHPPSRQLLMLFAFAKNEADDLTVGQRRTLRRVVAAEYR